MTSPAPDLPTPDDLTRAIAAGVVAGVGHAPVDEELWERRMRALTLRNAGGTFSQIAAQLHISATVARADVRLALREVLSETTEDFIARQRSVLLDCQRGAYPGALSGDKDSIMAIVRCLEQEAKLLGLYAPVRQVVGISDVDFAEQAAELITKLKLQPPKELMQHVRSTKDGGAAVAGLGGADHGSAPVEVGEIIDGVVERFWPGAIVDGVPAFDIPAYDLPIEADQPLGADISDAAVGAAAAAAIDPDRFGDGDDAHNGAGINGGTQGTGTSVWSNL